MTIRKYFILAILFAVLAIVCQLKWLNHVSRAVGLRAKSTTWSEAQKAQAGIMGDNIIQNGRPYLYCGVALAAVGFVMWLMSLRRQEPAWKSLPIALLVCYLVILIFLMI